jgi:hypothetical protein
MEKPLMAVSVLAGMGSFDALGFASLAQDDSSIVRG